MHRVTVMGWAIIAGRILSACAGGTDHEGNQRVPAAPRQGLPEVPMTDGLLCPTCTPISGGETSDFGGGNPLCYEERRAITEEVAQRFRLNDALEQVSSALTTSLRWQRGYAGGYFEPAERVGEPTTLHATITLGELSYFESAECGNWIEAPAHVEVETDDGGIEATTVGPGGWSGFGIWDDRTWQINTTADLSGVRGTLDIEIDESRPHAGLLRTIFQGFPDGIRGIIAPEVRYFESDAAAAGYSDTFCDADCAPAANVFGAFPDDACRRISFPLDKQSPHSWLGGRSFADVYGEAAALITTMGPQPARWKDGSATDVTVLPGEVGVGDVCLGVISAPAPFVEFDATTRIVSTDNRVQSTLMRGRLGVDSTGQLTGLSFTSEYASVPIADLASATGVSDVNVDGGPTVSISITAGHDLRDVPAARGEVNVVNVALVDCLYWPTDTIPPGCGP